jgi:hypothetical protein
VTAGALRGVADRLVAPGAAPAELVLAFGIAFAGAALAVAQLGGTGAPAVAVAVVAVVAFDLFGGAVVNATAAAKRRFHATGTSPLRRFLFVAAHVQPYLLALVVPGMSWTAAAAVHGLVVLAAVAVVLAPPGVRRPLALGAAVLVIAAVPLLVAVPAALGWVAPVLVVKLLLGHLLPGGEEDL